MLAKYFKTIKIENLRTYKSLETEVSAFHFVFSILSYLANMCSIYVPDFIWTFKLIIDLSDNFNYDPQRIRKKEIYLMTHFHNIHEN